jgi:Trypsin-like peptidase domain
MLEETMANIMQSQMLVLNTWITFFVLLFVLSPTEIRAIREIPEDNLAYPVQINLTDCRHGLPAMASGFFLNTGKSLYLVTARHVIFGAIRGRFKPDTPLLCKEARFIAYSKDPKEKQKNIIDLNLEVLNKNANVKAHETHDTAVVYMGVIHRSEDKQPIDVAEGVSVKNAVDSGILLVKIESARKFDEVLTPNEVYVFGYPSSIGLENQPQIDYQKPLIRKGIVSGTNDGNKTIILDCFIFPGNSGGPVMQVEWAGIGTKNFWIIGVISEFIPITETWLNERFKYRNTQVYNSGYSVAVPMDMVLELVN